EVLECVVGPVADNDRRRASLAAIDPDSVWRIELSFPASQPAEARKPLAVLVVAVDVERTVPVGEQKAAVVKEGEVGGHEAIASPLTGGLGVFLRGIDARFHRRVLLRDGLSLEVQFGERLEVLVSADVEEFPAPLFADLNAV